MYFIFLIFSLSTFSVAIFYWSNAPHKSSIAFNPSLKKLQILCFQSRLFTFQMHLFLFLYLFSHLLSFLTWKWLKAWISYNFLISCIFIYQMEAEVFPSAVVCKQCQLDSCSAPSLGQSRERQRDVLHYKWDLVSYARQGSIKALSKKVSEGKKAES